MSLNAAEQLLAEAVRSMLDQESRLGLSIHGKSEQGPERGSEYLHNYIEDSFRHKVASTVHADSITAAFAKVHSYKYVDDPTFPEALQDVMLVMAVPAHEQKTALNAIGSVIKEMDVGTEQDAGYHPDLDDVLSTADIEQPTEHTIEKRQPANQTWKKGDASPGQRLS